MRLCAVVAPDPGRVMCMLGVMPGLLGLPGGNRASVPALLLAFAPAMRGAAVPAIIGDGLNMVAGAGSVVRSAAGKS